MDTCQVPEIMAAASHFRGIKFCRSFCRFRYIKIHVRAVSGPAGSRVHAGGVMKRISVMIPAMRPAL